CRVHQCNPAVLPLSTRAPASTPFHPLAAARLRAVATLFNAPLLVRGLPGQPQYGPLLPELARMPAMGSVGRVADLGVDGRAFAARQRSRLRAGRTAFRVERASHMAGE